jgi:hypothetical protein
MKSLGVRLNAFVLSAVLATGFLTGCGSSSSSPTSGSGAGQSTGVGAGPETQLWSGVPTSGQADTSFGLQSFTINTTTHMLYLNFTLPAPILPIGLNMAIPNLKGATIATKMGSGLNQILVFGIPLDHFVRNLNLQAPIVLPNGDSLPAVPGGSAPRFTCEVNSGGKKIMHVYGTLQYLAAFVPTSGFDPKLALTFPLMNSEKTVIMGYFATIPKKGANAGGLYISVVFPPNLARVIDTLYAGEAN